MGKDEWRGQGVKGKEKRKTCDRMRRARIAAGKTTDTENWEGTWGAKPLNRVREKRTREIRDSVS